MTQAHDFSTPIYSLVYQDQHYYGKGQNQAFQKYSQTQ